MFQDTQWNDIDYMDRNNDFTYDKKKFRDLSQFVDDIHSVSISKFVFISFVVNHLTLVFQAGMHYIPIIDAGVSASEKPGTYPPYDEGLVDDIFVKDATSGQPFIGKVWNLVSTVWPDFTNPKIKDYYIRMLQKTHKMFPFDGIWIVRNFIKP